MKEAVRKRNTANGHQKLQQSPVSPVLEEDIDDIKKKMRGNVLDLQIPLKHKMASIAVAVMSFFTTFYKIWYPAEVVFDEVHFGKFAGYYLQRTYFFDVHPPLAKLMLAAVGYLIGFDGVYNFAEIGQSYAKYGVPYLPLRALPASLNVASVYLVYSILKESGYSVLTCFLTSTLYLLDNAFIGQNRLIMLDSILIFYVLCSVYSYVRFRKLRHTPFTKPWYTWMCLTGVSMALTLSVKMIGLFTFAAIGIAVIIDLWDMLELKNGLDAMEIIRHFTARCFGLIVLPIFVYLFWFYVHFSILKLSGPGDNYMSIKFKQTLADSPARLQSLNIMYNQSVRLQNKESSVFLHSHEFNYPAQYEDGRYSARGQQVVGSARPDFGSYWRIIPTQNDNPDVDMYTQFVKNNDVVQFEHIITGSLLLSHDVASPLTTTNQELTTTRDETKYNKTLFRIIFEEFDRESPDAETLNTLLTTFYLVHVDSNVGIKVNPTALPEWGQRHFEINGDRKSKQPATLWMATDILGIDGREANKNKPKRRVRKMNFLSKFMELQKTMIVKNSELIDPHPYQSHPQSWPLMTRGISYWTKDKTKEQIYLTGNVAGWWSGFLAVFVYCAVIILDLGLQKRGMKLFRPTTRVRLNRTGGFFLLLWGAHYFPFFLMHRALFLHHYLSAMACNYLLLGAVFEYFFVDGVNSPISYQPPNKKHSVDRAKATLKSYIAASILIGMQFMVYLYLAPFTYGDISMTPAEVSKHKVLKSWDLQFAKVETS